MSSIHLIGGGEAVFLLNCPHGPLELREVYGFSRSELGRIEIGLGDHLAALCDEWRSVHGRY